MSTMTPIPFPRQRAAAATTAAVLSLAACAVSSQPQPSPPATVGTQPTLPAPNPSGLVPTLNIAPAAGWPAGTTPAVTEGLAVTRFAGDLDHPRWLHVLPNGDVLVAESNAPPKTYPDQGPLRAARRWVQGLVQKRAGAGVPSANRISLLRDADGDGTAETKTVLIENLMSPFGMQLIGDRLYIANADAIVHVPYAAGTTRIDAAPRKLTDLPGGPINHHWTKNILASRDGRKLYATVGSNSNIAENGLDNEQGRAAIWEVDVASGDKRLYASGLRNPNGLAWEPTTGALHTVVNERDELGNDLVPDYLTSVRDGAFYGWPWSYYGQHVDTRVEPTDQAKVAAAVVPDYSLGAHVAALGLASSQGLQGWPAAYASGMFIGEHGSWNRRPLAGYKVVFVPFVDGKPSGQPIDVLTRFVDDGENARGRPVGVAVDRRGGLLVADDVGNVVWRVTPATAR